MEKAVVCLPTMRILPVVHDSIGIVTVAPGTVLGFSVGDRTEVPFSDTQGNLQFTPLGAPGFAGDQITVETNAEGRMTRALLLRSNGDRFVFDANGDLVRIEDRNGNAVVVVRDASTRRILRLEDPSRQKGIDLTYNENGFVTRVMATGGQHVSYAYDSDGRLVAIANALGQTTKFGYDSAGRLATITDPRGITVLTNTYDTDDRVTEQILSDGSRLTSL